MRDENAIFRTAGGHPAGTGFHPRTPAAARRIARNFRIKNDRDDAAYRTRSRRMSPFSLLREHAFRARA
ncbi:MAG: hypothetical protein AB7H70_12580 [Rhodospirillaceae bacterium]